MLRPSAKLLIHCGIYFWRSTGSSYEEGWRVFHTKKGVDGRWNGDYKTADDALAALQIEYWKTCSAVLRGLAFRVATRWSQSRSAAGTWAPQAM
jgi:hypothetical protein